MRLRGTTIYLHPCRNTFEIRIAPTISDPSRKWSEKFGYYSQMKSGPPNHLGLDHSPLMLGISPCMAILKGKHDQDQRSPAWEVTKQRWESWSSSWSSSYSIFKYINMSQRQKSSVWDTSIWPWSSWRPWELLDSIFPMFPLVAKGRHQKILSLTFRRNPNTPCDYIASKIKLQLKSFVPSKKNVSNHHHLDA